MKRLIYLRKLLPVALVLGLFAGCTDWPSEYLKKLDEAYAPVKDKYEFAEKIYHSLDTTNAEPLTSMDRLTDAQRKKIRAVYAENADSIDQYHPDQWMVLNNNIKVSDYYEIFDDSFFEKGRYNLKSYYDLENESDAYAIKEGWFDKDRMELKLSGFEEHFLNPITNFKYLIVLTNEIVIEPEVELFKNSFESGLILARAQVYDLTSKRKIDNFDVIATNSATIGYESGKVTISGDNVDYTPSIGDGEEKITKNLWKNLRKNAIATAAKRLAKR